MSCQLRGRALGKVAQNFFFFFFASPPFASVAELTAPNYITGGCQWLREVLNSSLTSCQGLCHQPSQRAHSKGIRRYDHSKSLSKAPKGTDNLTMTLSAPESHIESHLMSSSAAYLGIGGVVLPPSWSLTKIQPAEVTQYKAFSHFAKLTNLITVVKFLGSFLDQVSLAPWAAHPSVPQDSIDFPRFPRSWTLNMSRSFVITHWNSHGIIFSFIAIKRNYMFCLLNEVRSHYLFISFKSWRQEL